jgi:hypothetical protein
MTTRFSGVGLPFKTQGGLNRYGKLAVRDLTKMQGENMG